MEFGIFNSLHLPKFLTADDPEGAEHARLMDEVEYVRAADRSGFKHTWATEHHFLTEYSHLSANEAFLSYCAGVTSNIHLGTGIFNITPPVNHPARVAERVAMIDHLSGGRFEFGTGRGSSTIEQQGFGIPDPDLTKEMFDEVIPEFKRMWRDGDYSFDGRFFSMPPRNVLPKPFTTPHAPSPPEHPTSPRGRCRAQQTSAPTSSCSGCSRPPCRSTSASRPSRPSAHM